MRPAWMRGLALLTGSLGIHVVALAALPALFPSTPTMPLFVDLTTLDEAARGASGDGSAGGASSGTKGDGASHREKEAPARAAHPTGAASARRAAAPPVDAPPAGALRMPAPSEPAPVPTPSAPTDIAPAPASPPIVSPTPPTAPPVARTPPASPPVAASPDALPKNPDIASAPSPPAADRPALDGSRSGGREARSDAPGEGTGVPTSGAGGPLALARPGAGPGPPGSVPPEYAVYLARFRQRVEEAIVYPLAARRQGRGGRVELDVLLEPSGRVTRVDVVTSSDSAALDDAAVDAVKAVEAVPFPAGLPRRPLIVRIPLVFQLR